VNLTLTSDPGEPKTFKEALIGPDRDKWIKAIKKEITNFMSSGVWKPVSRNKVVSIGFMQMPGVDYTESSAPVASDTAIRVIISMFLYYHRTDKKNKMGFGNFGYLGSFPQCI
jgi:hypothetical protein